MTFRTFRLNRGWSWTRARPLFDAPRVIGNVGVAHMVQGPHGTRGVSLRLGRRVFSVRW
jgi:hypothetical protein